MAIVFSYFEGKEYTDLFPKVEILSNKTKDIFLKCKAINVTMPILEKNIEVELNIFELSILRFLQFDNYDIETLSQKICLEKDLIENIILTLIQKGFIDNNSRISDLGKNYLYKFNEHNFVKNIKIATFFLDMYSGKLLPFIRFNDNKRMKLDENEEIDESIIKIGNSGTEEIIKGTCINYPKEKNKIRIDEYHIKNNIFRYNKNEKINEDKKIKINNIDSFKIDDNWTDIYLHLKIFIQEGDASKIIVSDGFQASIKELEPLFNNDDNKFVRCVTNILRRTATENKEEKEEKEGNYIMNNSKYFEIFQNIEELKKQRNVEEDKNRDTNEQDIKNKNEKIAKYFDILEWTLFYYLRKNYPRDIEVLTNDVNQNKIILSKILNVLKLDYSFNKLDLINKNKDIKKVVDHKDSSFKTLLPLAIIESKYNKDSKLIMLFKKYNLDKLFEFLEDRNSIKHGGKVEIILLDEKLSYYELLVKDFLRNLLGIVFESENIKEISTSSVSGDKNKAIIKSQEIFGSSYLNLKEDLRLKIEDYFINIERNSSSNILILLLNNILEIYLYDYLKNIDKKIENMKNIDEIVSKKIKRELPKKIEKVKDKIILNIYNNKSGTLGGYIKVLYSESSFNLVQKLEKECEFMNIVEKLLELRGHGSNIFLIDKNELENYENRVFKIIKILGV